ncbi:MAG: class I SAM-dependent methyltransferase [Acidobacteriaceae bacterium]|nr:class I SAM-dependent methyltransferase [Acidobacteriaceae bacterium]MBV9780604.1 class I SAM-dependent methyltransferase [Acidobacteriaceae bacterium]
MRFRMLRFGILISTVFFASAIAGFGQRRNLSEFKNNLAPFVTSPGHAVDKMLNMANLKPGETLYDLGCGDGRILIAAAEKYRVKAVGIEISEHLAKTAVDNVKKHGLEDQVKIVHGDFMQTDLSPADVVTLYLATAANESLRPNLERYLRPNTRVVSYDYPIPGWKPMDASASEGRHGVTHTIYLYQVPNSIVKK